MFISYTTNSWADSRYLSRSGPKLQGAVVLTTPGNGAIRHTGTKTLRLDSHSRPNMDVPQETEHEC